MGRKRCLVTGAGGFLGTYMVEHLVAQGHEVLATDLPGHEIPESADVRFVPSDLLDRASLLPLFDAELDYVFHFGALVSLRATLGACRAVNVGGVRHVCELAGRAGVRALVQASSGGVYGNNSPAAEDAPKSPIEAYARSKLEGEAAALEHEGLPIVFIRPGMIYGRGMSRDLARGIYTMAELGLMVIPSGRYLVPLVHVEDVAASALFLAEKLAADPSLGGEAFNVVDCTPMPVDRLLELIAEVLGIRTLRVPAFLVMFAAYAGAIFGLIPFVRPLVTIDEAKFFLHDHVIEVKKLQGLGFVHRHPRSEEGFRELIELVRDNEDKTVIFERRPLEYSHRLRGKEGS